MKVSFDLSALKKTSWHDYALRFLFGGAVTVGAGLLARQFGPELGGLFLAFPAILPASVTLVEDHQNKKRQRAGIQDSVRGRQAAGLEAYGAGLGSVGLVSFAVVTAILLPAWSSGLVLLVATTVWVAVSISIWRFRKSGFFRGRS